ncbi:MAG: nuclear transport factor 2 family protein [Bacteroidia bacterium]|nr:nuclear transport factor 2 family protein [Bacteroidia bacterium]
MEANKALIEKFYAAFAHADPQTMVQCYHPDIRFQDPAFGVLNGDDARNMWLMLVNPGLKLMFSNVEADERTGRADWVAVYTFSKTGRQVTNRIHAEFEFKDGLIYRHTDTFSFHKWASQALGLSGKLLGRTSFLQNKVRTQALENLRRFSEKKKGAGNA